MKKHILFTFLIFSLFSPYCFATPQPSGLNLEPSSNSIYVTWNSAAVSDLETEGYYIFYWVTDAEDDYVGRFEIPGKLRQSHTISGLESSTSYSVYLTAYDSDRTESIKTTTITTTTHNLDVTVEITSLDEITVSISTESTKITTFDVSVVEIGEGEDFSVYTGHAPDKPYIIPGMVDGVTYEISLQTKDSSGSVIDHIQDIPNLTFEPATTFFSEAGKIENGCFVNSSPIPFSILKNMILCLMASTFFLFLKNNYIKTMVAFILIFSFCSSGFAEDNSPYKNTIGIKGGYFAPSESYQADVYDKIIPVFLFYERSLSKYFSADIEAGYSESDGLALSSSGPTGVETELKLIPLAMSVNLNLPITPLVNCFFGVGGDWWNYKEKSSAGEYEGDVGGWHAKTGVRLYTADTKYYNKVGVLLEANYAQIDRFGKNDVDLGGWTYNLGLIYSF